MFFIIPFLPPLCCCCCSCLSSIFSCGDKIPFIKDKLPLIYTSSSSTICILVCICIALIMGALWAGKSLLG